ncbi:hypothetical protein QBC47DRAFT_203405 [Echria macrotheca]|uniref:Uncharacterized protein n=1 Tax=Echria macrotheca TaxID=438768 RepID=A0AAJ0BAX5_9PEZI|nr:hypothetical protein QBC47DRAFT_203405 [Echria macrotheca]
MQGLRADTLDRADLFRDNIRERLKGYPFRQLSWLIVSSTISNSTRPRSLSETFGLFVVGNGCGPRAATWQKDGRKFRDGSEKPTSSRAMYSTKGWLFLSLPCSLQIITCIPVSVSTLSQHGEDGMSGCNSTCRGIHNDLQPATSSPLARQAGLLPPNKGPDGDHIMSAMPPTPILFDGTQLHLSAPACSSPLAVVKRKIFCFLRRGVEWLSRHRCSRPLAAHRR